MGGGVSRPRACGPGRPVRQLHTTVRRTHTPLPLLPRHAAQTMGRQSKAGTTGDTPPRTAESHADSHASGEDGDGPEQVGRGGSGAGLPGMGADVLCTLLGASACAKH